MKKYSNPTTTVLNITCGQRILDTSGTPGWEKGGSGNAIDARTPARKMYA